jgi:hypothetical protein
MTEQFKRVGNRVRIVGGRKGVVKLLEQGWKIRRACIRPVVSDEYVIYGIDCDLYGNPIETVIANGIAVNDCVTLMIAVEDSDGNVTLK